ncbi:MAG: hypothetical protein GEV10_13855 [Streptosporangiales bacterium]|nr:hypothetical protein [Streptosporangiales bacterium]
MSAGQDGRYAGGARAAAVTAAVTLGLWVWLAWAMVEAGTGPPTVQAVAWAVVVLGLPFAIAAAAVAWHVARAARGPDAAARLLALATAGRHGRGDEWGAAMRAELASITDPAERRQFALGFALTALRTDWGRMPRLVATVSFLGFAALTFAASRIMLAGDRGGILVGALVPGLVLLAVGLVAARSGRSFRAGLESGVVGLLAALAGVLVAAVPEAVTWYHEAGAWILDGDAPMHGIAGPGEAVRNALSGLSFFYLLVSAPWPVIGAALGAWRRRRPEVAAPPADAPAGSTGSAQTPELGHRAQASTGVLRRA